MGVYNNIKKEHLFIFLVVLAALIIISYFNNYDYTGLITKNKETCYEEGYSCCLNEFGKGANYFSLDGTCRENEGCWEYCESNLISTKASFIDSVNNYLIDIKDFFNKIFKKQAVGTLGTQHSLVISKSGSGTIKSSDGKINCGGTCSFNYALEKGIEITLTPVADEGFTFSGWQGCDGTSENNECEILMNDKKTITATFNKIIPCIKSDPDISITPSLSFGNLLTQKNYTIRITNRDNERCNPSIFNLTIKKPADDWEHNMSNYSLELNPGQFYNVNLSIKSNDTAVLNQNYKINITVFNETSDKIYINSKTITYRINTQLIKHYCGDGIVNEGEECDGDNLDSQTCSTLGYSSGALLCNPPLDEPVSGAPTPCTFKKDNCELPILPRLSEISSSMKSDRISLYWTSNIGEINNQRVTGYKVNRAFLQGGNAGYQNPYRKTSFELNLTRDCNIGRSSCNFTDNNITLLENNTKVKYEVYAYNVGPNIELKSIIITMPNITNFAINEHPNARLTSITMNITAPNAYQCRFANKNNNISNALYNDYAKIVSWTLPGNSGLKEVYAQCKNMFGESGIANANTTLQERNENQYPNGCNNNLDDDNDGIFDGLDKDCNTSKIFINRIIVNDPKPFDNADFEVQCKIALQNFTLSDKINRCVNLSIIEDSDYDSCNFVSRANDVLKFKCNSGEIGEKEVSCEISDRCNTLSNQSLLNAAINVTAPRLCTNIIGEDKLSIDSIELDEDEYDIGDKINAEVKIDNLDSEDLNIVLDSYLYNINNKRQLTNATLTKLILSSESETFDLKLDIPEVNQSKFRLYFKAYQKNRQTSICLQDSEDVLINAGAESNFTVYPPVNLTTLEIIKNLGSLDEFKFIISREVHKAKVVELSEEDVVLEISSTPEEITLEIGDNEEVDVNDDGENDIIITLKSISNNKARIGFKSIKEDDNDNLCSNGQARPCGSEIGICRKGTQTCTNNAWGECIGEVKASIEICDDNLDNNCNNLIDCNDDECSESNECKNNPLRDSDNDGLPDEWELRYFGNLNQNAEDDFDGDGYANLQEYSKDTDPTNNSSIPSEKSSSLIIIITIIVVLIFAGILIFKFTRKPKKPSMMNINQQTNNTDPALLNYVKGALKQGISKEQIKNILLQKGWKDKDIEDAFKNA